MLAIYASTSGNTELVIEAVTEHWRQRGIGVQLMRAEQTDPREIQQHDLFLFGTSTWEHGRINPFFDALMTGLKTMSCAGKQAAFIGLGDTRYEPVLFCGGMQTLHDRWLAQGGSVIGEPLKIDGEPQAVLTTSVQDWAAALVPSIQTLISAGGSGK